MSLQLLLTLALSACSSKLENNPEVKILNLSSYSVIMGEMIAHHYIYIGIPDNAVKTFEPLFDAFTERLYGLTTTPERVVVRYKGTFESINPDDFTDVVLAWNGNAVGVEFSLTNKIRHDRGRDIVTDIYMDITRESYGRGIYTFTGKYKDIPFDLYIKVDFVYNDGIPASPTDLSRLSVTSLPVGENRDFPVTDISFHFTGTHQSLNINGITDLQITKGGSAITFGLYNHVVRHMVYEEDETDAETVFTLVLDKPLASPGLYQVSGYYMGEPFSLRWTQWE